jgi:glucose-6-phosphate 1-dehydrogenase
VPVILRCGSGLDDTDEEIRLQFKTSPPLSDFDELKTRNEIVIKLSPRQRLYLKFLIQSLTPTGGASTLQKVDVPVFKGDQRTAECCAQDHFWKDYLARLLADDGEDPVLETAFGEQELEQVDRIMAPMFSRDAQHFHAYTKGTRGPDEADQMCDKVGYLKKNNW